MPAAGSGGGIDCIAEIPAPCRLRNAGGSKLHVIRAQFNFPLDHHDLLRVFPQLNELVRQR
jgi:hypothetical protein